MLRKLKHVGKKACKYRFTASLNQLDVQATKSWQPYKLLVVLARKKKRKTGQAQSWHPSIENPYRGVVKWPAHNQETLEISVTLFKDANSTDFEAKEWVIVLENEATNGKRKAIATSRVDMTQYVSDVPAAQFNVIQLKPLSAKLKSASLSLSFTCVFISEGLATEADLASMADSSMTEDTINLGDIDIGNIRDLDDMDFENDSRTSSVDRTSKHSATNQAFLDLTQQIDKLNQGVNDGSEHQALEDAAKSKSPRTSVSSMGSAPLSATESFSNNRKPSTQLPTPMNLLENEELTTDKSTTEYRHSASDNESSECSTPPITRKVLPSITFMSTQEESPSTPIQFSPLSDQGKPLLRWCQKATDNYSGVKVTNFTTSWRNGLAMCALLHHYCPELIDYDNLNALHSKANINQALSGFKSQGIEDIQSVDASVISEKSKLVDFLSSVKKHFNGAPANVAESSGESESLSLRTYVANISSKQVIKRTKNLSITPTLCEMARLKLLSDLEEKEDEDDVFSANLDLILEPETARGQNFESPITPEVFAQLSPVFKQPKGTIAPDIKSNTCLPEIIAPTFTQDLPTESMKLLSVSCAKLKTVVESSHKIDNHTSLGEQSSKKESKTKTLEKVESQIRTSPKVKTRTSRTPVFTSPTPEYAKGIPILENNQTAHTNSLPIDIVLEQLGMDSPKVKETSIKKSMPSSFSETKAKSEIQSSPATTVEVRTKTVEKIKLNTNFDSQPSEPLDIKIFLGEKPNLPKQNDKDISNELIEKQGENMDASYNHPKITSSSQPSPLEMTSEIQQHIQITEDKSETSQNIEKSLHEKSSTDTCILQENFPLDKSFEKSQDILLNNDSAIECTMKESTSKSPSHEVVNKSVQKQPTVPSDDDSLQQKIDQLLRSSAERNKRTTTNRLIEKAKVEALSHKPINQRQIEVHARALKLLDETRASIGVDANPNDDCNSPPMAQTTGSGLSSKALNVPSNEPQTTEPAASVLISSSNVKAIHVSADTTTLQASEESPIPPPSPDPQPTIDSGVFPDTEIVISPAVITEHLPPLPSTVDADTSPSSTSCSDLPLRQDVQTNAAFSSVNHRNELKCDSAENLTSQAAENSQTPSKPFLPTLTTSTPLAAEVPTTTVAGDISFPPDETDTLSPISNIKKREKSNKGTDRLSVASISELHRRWSTVLRQKSVNVDVISELENDRLALEKEMRLVEERSSEVQLELQNINQSGNHRSRKEREGQLTQEWFQLVHKKNAILREQDQLTLMEEDQSINRRIEKIHAELIPLMAIEDIMKTMAQKDREQILLEEKFTLVNERDRINQEMNEKEQLALEEEERLQTSLGQNMSKVVQQDEKCRIM